VRALHLEPPAPLWAALEERGRATGEPPHHIRAGGALAFLRARAMCRTAEGVPLVVAAARDRAERNPAGDGA
jgi:hypothetical protein